MLSLLRHYGFSPRSCVWELTLACNLNCKHCGSFAGQERPSELSLDECLRVAEELIALGCRRVTLGGGEPTLSPHWDALGRRLIELGAKVNIISNGWHWREKQIERALRAGLTNVAFSLDGMESSHDLFRREGSFARVLGAIDVSVEAGMPVSVNTTVHAFNQHELGAIRELLAEHRVSAWQIQIATATGHLKAHQDFVIAPQDMLDLVPTVAALRAAGGRPTVHPSDDIGYYGKVERALRDTGGEIPFWIGCRAGCQVIGIESNGNIKGCLSLPSERHGEARFVEGNVRQESLAAIWNHPHAFAFNREYDEATLGGFCALCRYREFCRGGCTWTAYSQAGDGRRDNLFCFYRQAVQHQRLDLLSEPPLPEEEAYFR